MWSRRTRVVLMALAALCVVAWLLREAPGGRDPAGPLPEPRAADAEAPPVTLVGSPRAGAPTNAGAPDSAAAAATSAPAPGPRPGSIAGRVIDGEGRPAPGVHVVARTWNPEQAPAARARAVDVVGLGAGGPQTESADDGTFLLDGVAPGAYQLAVRTDLYLDEGVAHVVELAAGQHLDGIELRLRPAAHVRGVVLGIDDRPVPHLALSLRRRGAVHDGTRPGGSTGEDGRFDIRVKAEGQYAAWASRGVLLEGAAESGRDDNVLHFDPTRMPELVVRILDTRGALVPRVHCTAMTGATPGSLNGEVQDVQGGMARFRVSTLSTYVELHVECARDEHGAKLPLAPTVVRDVDPLAGEVVVHLQDGAPITGRVVDEDGNPVAGIGVFATSRDTVGPGCLSRDDGTFELIDVPAGPTHVAASRSNAGWLATPPLEVTAPATDVVVRVRRAATLDVEVVGPEGEPVPHVRVHASAPGHAHTSASGMTDAAGRILLKGLPPGARLDVRADAERASRPYASTGRALRTSAPGTLRILLDAGLEIRGVVVDEHGAPQGLRAIVGRDAIQGGTVENTVSEVKTGAFVLRRMRAGRAHVWLGFGPDNQPPTEPIEVAVPSTDVRLVVPGSIEVRGRLLVQDPAAWFVQWPLGMAAAMAELDADGSFRIAHATGARGTLLARPLDATDLRVAILEHIDPAAGPYLLEPIEAGFIEGRIQGADPDELKGWRVRVLAARGPVRVVGHADETGAFRIPGLPPGLWDVELWTDIRLAIVPAVEVGRTDVVIERPPPQR